MPWGAVAGAVIGAAGSSMAADSAEDAANQQANGQAAAGAAAADAAKFRPVGLTSRFGNSRFSYDSLGNLTNRAGFNEQAYLAANPDVAAAVASGQFTSGRNHYDLHGQAENRPGASFTDTNATGYQLSGDLASMRDELISRAGGWGQAFGGETLQNGVGLYHTGQQYVGNPQESAANWMQSQQNLLAPSRERQLAGVRNGLFNTGRTGLAVGATGARPDGSQGLGAANPEMEAYYNAMAQQDAQLATQAQEQGRLQTQFGVGLMNSGIQQATNAYSPLSTWLGTANTIEGLGQSSLDMSAQLGGRSATAGATAGQFLMQSGTNAANTLGGVSGYSPWGSLLQGAASNPQLQSGISGLFSGYGGYAGSAGGSTAYPSYGMASGPSGAWV